MYTPDIVSVITLLWASLCVSIFKQFFRLQKRPKLPPGPQGLPIIGNVLGMPKSYEWLHWANHHDLYGPISSVHVLGTRLIILNDLESATELLETRSSIYSNRPTFAFAGKMIGWDQQMILSQYDDRFRLMRKYVKNYIGTKSAIDPLKHIQEAETRYFLARVLDDPASVIENLRRTEGAIFLEISQGYAIDTASSDPLVELVEKAAKEFHTATLPGEWLIDSIPLMRFLPEWFPGQHFKNVGATFRQHNYEQAFRPLDFVRLQREAHIARPSFTSYMLDQNLNAFEEDIIPWATNSVYGGGTDTTTAALTAFVLAMVIHPDIQKQAQKELDSVVGNHRLPRLSDRSHLPFMEALLKEILRWHPIGPMGIPHCVTQDDYYKGYLIPQNSIVMVNIWKIARDSTIYPNPEEFDPHRYVGDNPQLDPMTFVYGFGRRACPGKELANANMFLLMSMFLSVFDLSHAKDASGKDIPVVCKFGSGTVSHPEPFSFQIKPRSPDAEALIRSISDEHPLPPSDAPNL